MYTNKNEFWCLVDKNTLLPICIYLTQIDIEQEIHRVYGTLNNTSVISDYHTSQSVDFNNWKTVLGSEFIDWIK
jgi:hypothetical protein